MNILITGCNGQLGHEILILERTNTQHRYFNTDIQAYAEDVENYFQLDITDKCAVWDFVTENNIDGIINCAAYTAVDEAERNRSICATLNSLAPAYLAESIDSRNGWIIHISTDYVFDGTAHTPYVEQTATCPASVYGDTKLAGEIAVSSICSRHVIIRTSWLYSEYGKNFVKTMVNLGKTRDELSVIFDQTGTPTYALDLAEAIFSIISHGIVSGIYHYSNEGVCSWYDFTQMIARIAGHKDCNIQPCYSSEYPSPVTRPSYSVLDKRSIRETFGIEVPFWVDSLEKCIANIKKQQTNGSN